MPKRWTEIKGYKNNTYSVSNDGEVRLEDRLNRRGVIIKGHILNQHDNSNGYPRVYMHLEGQEKGKDYFVHRLVAEAFIPKIEGKPYVNHRDGNKHNNSVDNLEWCTKSENELHAHRTGLKIPTPLKGELHGGRKFNWDDIRAIREEYVKGDRDHGQCALARKYNTSQAHIYYIVTNKNWKEFEEDAANAEAKN